ncbi:MAG: hypothetical protein OIF55_21365 [Amphritea sp.]|nr:hypothetical protein [Amphritea sp.]
MVKKLLVCGVCAGLLSGCFQTNTSQAPLASTYPISEQQKMQAAHHWNVLAEHEAELITQSLPAITKPLYITESAQETPFGRGFSALLTSKLVQQGADIRTRADGAATIRYQVEVLEHTDRDSVRQAPGTWTALAAGVAVAALSVEKWNAPEILLAPAAIGADLYSGNRVAQSNHEVIITTQIVQGNRVLHSSSNIYYINGGDKNHYNPPEPSTTTIPVTG